MATVGPPPRVLLAEDEEALAAAVSGALRERGLACAVVHDGPSAVAGAERLEPDLLLLDLMLPGLDGFEVARRVRERREVPVVFLTARDAPDDRLRGFAAGADDYVVKPFLLAELVRCRGRVRSKTQLLSQVWGYDAFDPNPVEVHVSSLRRKLEAGGEVRLLHTVRGLGYVLRETRRA